MNTWSSANHCGYPDEDDADTMGVPDETALDGEACRPGSGSQGAGAMGGLLARNSAGSKQKANGRLSYRDIIFNNDGKLRPPYSLGPLASASAAYLFPRPADARLDR